MRVRDGLGSLAVRVFALLCVGIVAAAALAFTAADLQRRDTERRGREQRLVERTADLAGVLQRAPTEVRPMLLGVGPEAPRLTRAAPTDEPLDAELTGRLAARLGTAAAVQATEPTPQGCAPPPASSPPPAPQPPPRPDAGTDWSPPPPPPPPPRRECRRVALTLAGGERVTLILPSGPRPRPEALTPFSPLMLLVLASAAAALAYVTARLATAPVRRLASAAEALGRDLDRPPLPEAGPTEVRQGARAFNAMQVQLKRREDERTHMLAAITHDLQTPLTRLRLRLEKVADPTLRAALIADQAAMKELIRDGLNLARAAAGGGGPLQELDVDSLLQSLCEDAADAGAQVSVTGRCGAVVRTRPEALKRCIANLLDNALKHAGAAELSATCGGGGVELWVLDRGPGIPDDQLQAVFDPFVRLETSRSRETGGSGLGLTIARLMAEHAQGELRLTNRSSGGLCAVVLIPSAPRNRR